MRSLQNGCPVLCRDIFETMYFAALTTSCELAERDGTYPSYEGSPMSKGIVQPDMWHVDLSDSRLDWPGLRARIAEHGVRPLLVACVALLRLSVALAARASAPACRTHCFVFPLRARGCICRASANRV